MFDRSFDHHMERGRINQSLSAFSPSNASLCLFNVYELLAILVLFFATVVVVQIDGFDSPMIYDSVEWRDTTLRSQATPDQSAVIRILPERSLFLLSLHLNYSIHGMDPVYFRVFNALILAGTGVALIAMLNMIMLLPPSGIRPAEGPGRLIVFLIGLLYVVHPLQVFVVLYIWQRAALMACLFYFTALAVYTAGRAGVLRRPTLAYSLTASFYFLGLLSKENIMTLPLTIALVEFVFFARPLKGLVKRVAAIALVALMVLLPYMFLSDYLRAPNAIAPNLYQRFSQNVQESGITWITVILTEPRVWFLYLQSVITPSLSNLQFARAMLVSTSFFDPPMTAVACLGVTGLVILGIALRRREPLISYGLFFFCVVLIPESLLSPQYLFAGYRAILPMAGLMLILARLLILASAVARRWLPSSRTKIALVASMCLAVLYLGLLTRSVSGRWSPLWIWEHSFIALPEYTSRVEISSYVDVSGNYGMELLKSGDYHGALEVLQQTANILDNTRVRTKSEVLLRLATVLAMMGRREEAVESFKQIIQIRPRWASPYHRLGALLLEAGDLSTALENFRTAVNLDPSISVSHYSLGTTLLLMGDSAHAVPSLEKALELKPDYPQASANLGMALLNLDKPKEAVQHLKTATAAFPLIGDLHISLARAYEKLGMVQEAEQHLKRVPEIDPNHQKAGRKLDILLPQRSQERTGTP
jgi:protein O-mannosyl-transferase